jgi:hypothetical protein
MSTQTIKTQNDSRDEMMETVQPSVSVTMSPELYEQLYLSPKNQVKGELRQTFGNPTPIGVLP